ncbi:MAG: tyrosine-type recombinase/integrase [Ignavibacteriales bacterium]|nr:tyrosine-type recombinase/integrase [Ignavibacteriales bacterium]
MSIKQKSNGKYEVDVRDEFGKRIQRTFKTKTEARAYEANFSTLKYEKQLIKNKLKEGRYLLETAFLDYKLTKQDLRPGSVRRYNYIITQISLFTKALGLLYVDEFTPDHASMFYAELLKEKPDPKKSTNRILRAKPKTVNFFIAVAKAFFQQELMKGHIKKSPMLHIRCMRVEKKKPEYFTEDELNAFFAQEMSVAYRNAFLGLLYTGMRFGELANLVWENVDMHKKLIYVRSTENFKAKTYNSERAIPMMTALCELLEKRKLNGPVSQYPFCTENGLMLRERTMLNKCKDIASRAGIESRAFLHKFRHTFATHLILKGVPIQNIKELLGHHSVVQTEIYAHNKADHLHFQVALINNLLLNK